jgi:hypothetical protein
MILLIMRRRRRKKKKKMTKLGMKLTLMLKT